MKTSKKHPITAREARQLEIIGRYYDVDIENRLITIKLHYAKASEILEEGIDSKHPILKSDLLERISEIISTFPVDFRSYVSIQIDDYENYDYKDIMGSFKDNMELFHYSVRKETNKRWISAAIFFSVSAILLAIRLFLGTKNYLDTNSMVYEMMDIIAWVFLWEAVTVLFLNPGELKEISTKIGRRIVKTSFLDEKGNVLTEIKRNELVSNWIEDTKLENGGRTLLIIAGALIFATGVVDGINGIPSFVNDTISVISSPNMWPALLIDAATLVESALFILGGIAAINIYRERGPLQKLMAPFSIIFMIFDTVVLSGLIFLCIYYKVDFKQTIIAVTSSTISLLASILYFISYLMLIRYRKREKEFEKQSKLEEKA